MTKFRCTNISDEGISNFAKSLAQIQSLKGFEFNLLRFKFLYDRKKILKKIVAIKYQKKALSCSLKALKNSIN